MDLDVIHGYLVQSYWARGIPRDLVARAIAGSLPVGAFTRDGAQVGFARVITDTATFAYLADVFVLESHREKGLGRWLVESILAHPGLGGLRRWMLATQDAHELYRSYGFRPLANPDRFMEIHRPNPYLATEGTTP